jgi:hypothetical protein
LNVTVPLVRDVMVIGVPVCRVAESCGTVAARLKAEGPRGAVVMALDDEGRAVGWAPRTAVDAAPPAAAIHQVLRDDLPQVPPDVPVAVAAQWLADQRTEYAFLMHSWPGEPRPAAFVARRDLEQRLEQP